jgi:hypothetical protein
MPQLQTCGAASAASKRRFAKTKFKQARWRAPARRSTAQWACRLACESKVQCHWPSLAGSMPAACARARAECVVCWHALLPRFGVSCGSAKYHVWPGLVITTRIAKGARANETSLDALQVGKMSVARPAAVLATLEPNVGMAATAFTSSASDARVSCCNAHLVAG